MTSKRFLTVFFGGFFGAAALLVCVNWYVDFYGLFRPVAGRRLAVYGEERTAKFLYSMRYIPESFDGVLFGSSVSDNLDTSQIHGYRIYNASIDGGNVSDMKPLAENIFRTAHMRVTLICVHRYLTNDHALKTDLMSPRQYWSALASPTLYAAYLSRSAVRAGLTSSSGNDFGVFPEGNGIDIESARKTMDRMIEGIRRGTASAGNYSIDPVALADLNSVLRLARSHSQRLLIYYPPAPAGVLELRKAELARYRDTIQTLLQPSDLVLDFNTDAYAALRADDRNFIDAVHLSQAGSDFVMKEIRKRLEDSGSGSTD